jgi:hypothetical protein
MIESMLSLLRLADRQLLHRIWLKAREGNVDALSGEERLLAEIMLDHADEFFNQFELSDVIGEYEFDPQSDTDPFKHVALHAVVENQLKSRNPVEVIQFYNAMRRKKCSHHDAIHLLGAILLHFLLPVLEHKRGHFELNGYRQLLRKFKSRRPEKIMGLLEREPTPFISESIGPGASQVFDEMRSVMGGRHFESLEEAQALASAFMEEKNRQPQPEFLGLSPEQMHRLLHQPLVDTDDIVVLNAEVCREDYMAAPVVIETVYFLKRLNDLHPLKSTAKGNLPLAFARELHDRFPEYPDLNDFRITSEEDDLKLMALRRMLAICGWIKKRHNKFSLTHKGQRIVNTGFEPNDFLHLIKSYMFKYNWGFRDRYPSPGIIQQSVFFSCYLLHKRAGTFVHTDKLGEYFIRAYPMVPDELEGYPVIESHEQTVRDVFTLRFIQRFCEYFGLVEIRCESMKRYLLDISVKTSSLFKMLFDWKL